MEIKVPPVARGAPYQCKQAAFPPEPPFFFHDRFACPHKVANGFMDRIRHPDRRQFAGSLQMCKRDSIAAIGLDLEAVSLERA
jgi:hypothetical protein